MGGILEGIGAAMGAMGGVAGAANQANASLQQNHNEEVAKQKMVDENELLTNRELMITKAREESQVRAHETMQDADVARNKKAGAEVATEADKSRLIEAGYTPEEAAKYVKDPQWMAEWKKEDSDLGVADNDLQDTQRTSKAAGLLGYKDQEHAARERERTIIEKQRADTADKRADAQFALATKAAKDARLPAEAQMINYMAENVYGDTSPEGMRKAADWVKKSKEKPLQTRIEEFKSSYVTHNQYATPDEVENAAKAVFGKGMYQGASVDSKQDAPKADRPSLDSIIKGSAKTKDNRGTIPG